MKEANNPVVPGTGLEPAHLTAPDPKSGVSTNSTTRASGTNLHEGDASNKPLHSHGEKEARLADFVSADRRPPRGSRWRRARNRA